MQELLIVWIMGIKEQILLRLQKSVVEIQQNMDRAKENASGRTRKTFQALERNGHLLLIQAEGDGAPVETLEKGREAGKVPHNFNSIIRQWIRDKGISVQQIPYKTDRPHKYSVEERSEILAAGAIAHKIKTQGTNRHKTPRNDIYSNVVTETLVDVADILKAHFLKAFKSDINTIQINK